MKEWKFYTIFDNHWSNHNPINKLVYLIYATIKIYVHKIG